MNIAKAIDTIYNEREKFIIIGLTGRTGSGCTTVSEILQAEEFSDLNMREPKTTNFSNINERKYQIIHSYAQNHWHAFKRISMTDMIFSFVLQYDYDSFINKLKDMIDDVSVNGTGEIIFKKIENELNKRKLPLKEEFDMLNKKIISCLDENGESLRKNKYYFLIEHEFLMKLPSVQTRLREIMQTLDFSYETKEGKTKKSKFIHLLFARIRK